MIFVSVFMVDCLFSFMLFFSLNYCFAAVLIATNKVEYTTPPERRLNLVD